MRDYGFYRVKACSPIVKIADIDHNVSANLKAVEEAEKENVDCIVFPELSITGYTCADLFQQSLLIEKAEEAIKLLAKKSEGLDIFFVVGAPVVAFGKRYNCAIAICNGRIVGITPKSYLPNYGEFYEKRWFESGKDIKGATIDFAMQQVPFGTDIIYFHKAVKIGIEICEDLWVPSPPSGRMAMAGAEIILNLSASDDLIGKHDYLLSLISQQSARCRAGYVYASAGWGESSTDLVFSGKAIIAEDGKIYHDGNRFSTSPVVFIRDIDVEKLRLEREKFNTFSETESSSDEFRIAYAYPESQTLEHSKKELLVEINPYPFVPQNATKLDERCEEILNIQCYGLMQRLEAIGCKKAIVGISGGLDSTLALLVTYRAFIRLGIPTDGIIGVTMPGFATTNRTKNNATALMECLGVTIKEIPIGKAVDIHFQDIGQDPNNYDATYENSQARERTQILMDLANKEGGIVIGTGDMSELALGWCTYNGDQMSMYGVNASVPKTLVRHLVEWVGKQSDKKISDILKDICDTPISPELVPSSNENEIAQKTENLVGPYELHDFFLYHFLRNSFSPSKIYFLAQKAFQGKYDIAVVLKWLRVFIRRFFSQQFKRSCMPDGPKVGSVNLSPRGDWRMPSDASPELWLRQLDEIENISDGK